MKKSKFKGGANKLTNSLKKTKKKISSNKKKKIVNKEKDIILYLKGKDNKRQINDIMLEDLKLLI